MRLLGKSLTVLGIALLVCTVWGALPASAGLPAASYTMQTAPLPAGWVSGILQDAWGSGAGEMYVAGRGQDADWHDVPLLYYYDGSEWNDINLSMPAGWGRGWLKGIWGSGASDVYTAGFGEGTYGDNLPLLYHYDGTGWSAISPSLPSGWGTGDLLGGVWGSGASDVYAAGSGAEPYADGYQPLLYHYDGTGWMVVSPALPETWISGDFEAGVWGSGVGDVYAAGSGQNVPYAPSVPLLYHYDGSDWTEISLPLPAGWHFGELGAIWGSGPSDVYVAGRGTDENWNGLSLLYHYDGSDWTTVSLAPPAGWYFGEVEAIWGSGPGDVYAGGYGRQNADGPELPLLYHYDGLAWTEIGLLLPPTWGAGELRGGWASGIHDVYATGYAYDADGYQLPLLYHYNGSQWTPVSLPLLTPPNLSVAPPSASYGVVKARGASLSKTFTVRNSGIAALTFYGEPSLTGTNPGQFEITSGTCSPATTLQQNETCTVTVVFQPTRVGSKSALLRFTDNAAGSPHDIALSGMGGTEQALNGGLNAYPSSTAKIPTNWVAANFATTDGKDTIYKKEGTASVKIAGQAGKNKILAQTRLLSGAAGDTFLLSLWRKGANIPATAGVVQAQVLFYNGSTWKQTIVMNLPTGTYGFTQQTKPFTATNAYTRIVIKLIYSKAMGAAWFDGLSLLRSP